MRLYLAGGNGRGGLLPAAIRAEAQNFLFAFDNYSGAPDGARKYSQLGDLLLLYIATGALHTPLAREGFYGAEARNALLSFASVSARRAAEFLAEHGEEELRLYLAGALNPKTHPQVIQDADVENVLLSYACIFQGRPTAFSNLVEYKVEDDMKLYVAGSLHGGHAKLMRDAGAENTLQTYAWQPSQWVAAKVATEVPMHELKTKELRPDMRLFIAGVGNGQTNWDTVERSEAENLLCSYGWGTSKLTAEYFAPRGGYTNVILYCAGVPCSAMNRGWVLKAVESEEVKSLLFSYAFPDTQSGLRKFLEEHKNMILYLAGSFYGGNQSPLFTNLADKAGAQAFLETFAHKSAVDTSFYIAERRFDINLFIDSGAFTAWVKGKPIVLTDYMAFCKDLMSKSNCPLTFAGLDIIPGVFKGEKPTDAVIEAACQEGFNNFQTMWDNGIACLATFHRGDPDKWLDILIDATLARNPENPYMCLAPKVDGSPAAVKMEWLNKCFRRIDDRGLLTKLRIHGLGISSPVMMETYPFYSVDSTAWLQGGRSGSYRHWDGYRATLDAQCEWKHNKTWCTECVERYREQGQADPTGEYGSYWYARACMAADVQLQNYITELWRQRGVEWK